MTTEELKVTISDPSSTEKMLEIEIPRGNFDSIYNEKVKKYSKELRLNGYRKGAVPKRIISERFREPLTNETLEKLVDQTIRDVCQTHSLEPVAPGRVEELKNENSKPIFLKALIEIDQKVELTRYKDLGVTLESPKAVSDSDIEAEISQHLHHFAQEETQEIGQNGDFAAGEYLSIKINGEEKPLPENASFRITIGHDKIPEFNQAFLGSQAGQEKEITVSYPDTYDNQDLAGKKGEYRVRIGSIVRKINPPIDDELAQKFGAESLSALQDQIRKDLEKRAQSEVRLKAEKEAVEKILAETPFDIPKSRINQYIEYQIHGPDYDASKGHHHHPEIPREQMEKMREQAEYALKKYRILELVASQEKVKASQEDVDQKVAELAEQSGMDFEALKANLRKSGRINEIREDLKSKLTMDLILGL